MNKSLCHLLIALGLVLPVSASAQVELKSYSGYESKLMSLDIEGFHPPALYFRSTTKGKRPLAIFLHGRGGDRGGRFVNTHSEIVLQLSEQNLACDVIHPLSKGGWSPKALDELIDLMIEKHDINKDRIYILGSSMGGAGTWKYGFEGKHEISAFVPIASGASKTDKVHDRWDITKMKDKPIWMFHGEEDTIVPFANAKETAEKMKAINPKFKWTTFPGVKHGSRGPALKTKELYSWLLKQTCASSFAETLTLRQDPETGAIRVFREGRDVAIMTQNAAPDFRPYLHPILSPDGKGVLTELSPSHHVHQTGVYWGFTRANGRDYFGNPGNAYWRRVSCLPLISEGETVQWETVYQMLDETGAVMMIETQRWTLRDTGSRYYLDLKWTGEAAIDVTIANYFYGGLFVRMPWHKGIESASVSSTGQLNRAADSQRALWVDVAMAIEGRDDWGHIAILAHPQNQDFPQPWRVDKQQGVGPSRAKLGGWKINKGDNDVYQHQLVIYTGELNDSQLNEDWLQYSGEKSLPPNSAWPGGVITIKKPK